MPAPLPTRKLLAILFRHQWLRLKRSSRTRSDRLVVGILCLLGLYMGFTLFVLGARFSLFAGQILPGANPLDLVHEHTIPFLLSLFGVRFLFERSPRAQLEPFRHLPLRALDIVAFYAGIGILSVHTLLPLLFAVPFAIWTMAPVVGGPAALVWTAGILGLLVASHFGNLYVRSTLAHRERLFLLGFSAILLVTVADEYLGTNVIGTTSQAVFEMLGSGDLWTLASVMLLVPASVALALGAMLQSLAQDADAPTTVRRAGRFHEMAERWDLAGHLLWLELRLMWRNRRPRHYLLISIMFSTVYLVFMLASKQLFGGAVFGAVVGLFASGGFALNYGQLMFGWDSSYFDGLLARSVRTRVLARTKLTVLQGSCLALFVISLPLFLWLRPDLVPLHVAFLFYNAGITSQLVMELATRNRNQIALDKGGGFFNYEGFSARHWLWFFPTAVPPTMLLLFLRDRPELAWSLLGLIGLLGLAATELWTRRHASVIDRNKYRMAAGFRSA